MIEKPNREPDLIINSYHFYFDEMIQYNSQSDYCYTIQQINGVYSFSFLNSKFKHYYSLQIQKLINNYFEKQVEKILLDS